jgi:hypothetical protein
MPSEKRFVSMAAARLSRQELSTSDYELGFGGAFRVIFVEEGMGVALVSAVILGGDDDGLAGQAMAQSVQLRALFTGFGAGSGRFLGVSAID